MSIRFIYGRSGSGKSRFCLNEIKTKITDQIKHQLVLLVPEQFTFQAERDLITVLKTGGILKVEVLSFQRMAFRVFNDVGGLTYPHIHSAGKCMILYRILDQMKDTFKVFSKSADRQGFVVKLSTLITECKRCNITPEMLGVAGQGLQEGHPLKEKLLELYAIYKEFERVVTERYRDSDDDLTQLADKLLSTSLYQNAEIWIDGFSGFTPQEYKVIERLLKIAGQITISLCADGIGAQETTAGIDVFSSVKIVYQKLVKMANNLDVIVEPTVVLENKYLWRFKNSPELSHLERNFNAYPYSVYTEKTKELSLFSSINIFTEIEATARDIVRLCRDQHLRYRDIAVVVRNLSTYERLIEVIFAEYEIPCFIDQKIDITNHPLVRLILSMLEIFNENWSYETVFRYLKTGLTGIERSRIDRLENYVLACGIRAGRWTSEKDWNMSPNMLPDERETEDQRKALLEINQIRSEVTEPLLAFRQKTKGRRKASEICSALYDFLAAIGIPERLAADIDQFRKNGLISLANEYSQVWNIVMEVLDQAVEVMGEETFGLERFSHILAIGLGEYKVGLIPASLDQVLVGSVERSRSHEVKAVFILGINDGVFPAASAEEELFSDQDRAILQQAGIELASDSRTKAFEEQYLVYRALTTAGSFLRLSWPIADHEGKTLRPSIIISRLRKLFLNLTETSNIQKLHSDDEEMELITGKTPTFKQLISAIRQKMDGEEIKPLWLEVYRWYAGQQDWQKKCESAKAAFLYQNIAQPVSRDKMAGLYGSPAFSSVSRLEKYTACPFAYYVQYGLNAKERKIYQLRPPDVGSFLHTVIEKFSEQLVEQKISWRSLDKAWCIQEVSIMVEEMLTRMKGSGLSGSKRYTALTVRLKRVISRAIWLIAEHIRRSGFDPIGYEISFGKGGTFPPISIPLASGETVYLSGRIDRVDAFKAQEGTYLRIVDYKSGRKDFHLSDVFYGLQLQLITYLDAIWESNGWELAPPLLPGGMLYFTIDDPIVKGSGQQTEEEIEKAIMKLLKMKGLLLDNIEIIKEMDHNLEGPSLIIPARLNQGNKLGKSSVASMEQFKLLRTYVKKLLTSLSEEVMKGTVSIKPYKKKKITSCTYCSFSAVCQFDTAMKENTYTLLQDREDEDIWKRMEETVADKEDKE